MEWDLTKKEGKRVRGLLLISIALALCALAFAYYLIRKVSAQDAGTDRMKEIAAFIHEGASAFLMASLSSGSEGCAPQPSGRMGSARSAGMS